MNKATNIGVAALMAGVACVAEALPEGFVYLADIDPSIIQDVRYYGDQNFLGRRMVGYDAPKIICTQQAAQALKQANAQLHLQGYTLVVYDGYRPQMTVDSFRQWGKDPHDTVGKAYYYPTLEKQALFDNGYIADLRSTHTRGSTFDVTFIPSSEHLKPIVYSERALVDGQLIPFLDDGTVDMGSSFDLFHLVSWHDSKLVTPAQNAMRDLLRSAMLNSGFEAYPEEWWHYTLANEPYPETYFNFPIL